jgi:hypothetical protein
VSRVLEPTGQCVVDFGRIEGKPLGLQQRREAVWLDQLFRGPIEVTNHVDGVLLGPPLDVASTLFRQSVANPRQHSIAELEDVVVEQGGHVKAGLCQQDTRSIDLEVESPLPGLEDNWLSTQRMGLRDAAVRRGCCAPAACGPGGDRDRARLGRFTHREGK